MTLTFDLAFCLFFRWGLTKTRRADGPDDGSDGMACDGPPARAQACGGRLARRSRRRAAWFYIARFVTWSNQCALLHLLHQWTDAGAANGYSHTI